MTLSPLTRGGLVAAVSIVALGALGLGAFVIAEHTLKSKILEAIGPDGEVQSIRIGRTGIEITRLRIRAPKGWPVPDALRAQRVVVALDVRSLLSSRYRVRRISIEAPYLSVWRTADGRVHLVPGLTETPAASGVPVPGPTLVDIGEIALTGGMLDFFDESVSQPAVNVRLEQLRGSAADLQLPSLKGRTRLHLQGTVKGGIRDGALAVDGWADLATRDSSLTTKLSGVALVPLQPYLIKASETGVSDGALDLELQSTVNNNYLHAPGVITLSGLKLQSNGGAWNTFMGMPRTAVVSFMKNDRDEVSARFVLDGNVSDPKFSLNENLSTRVASSMAETLGVSVKSLAKGVGSGGQKGVETVGKALSRMFGKK